jgi:hypothetical protein
MISGNKGQTNCERARDATLTSDSHLSFKSACMQKRTVEHIPAISLLMCRIFLMMVCSFLPRRFCVTKLSRIFCSFESLQLMPSVRRVASSVTTCIERVKKHSNQLKIECYAAIEKTIVERQTLVARLCRCMRDLEINMRLRLTVSSTLNKEAFQFLYLR